MASDFTNSTSTNTVHTTFVRSTPHLPKHTAHPCSTTTTTTTGSRSQTRKHNPVNPPPKLNQHKSSYHHPQPTHQNKKTKPQIANLRHYQPSGLSCPSPEDPPWTSKTRDSAETTSSKSIASSPKLQPRELDGHTLRSPSPKKMSTSSATHTQMLLSSRQISRAGGLAEY